jgi:hypothetical protein
MAPPKTGGISHLILYRLKCSTRLNMELTGFRSGKPREEKIQAAKTGL